MVDRAVHVRIRADLDRFNAALLRGAASAKKFSQELETSDSHASMLVQSAIAIGPALVPIGASAVPAVAGLANQLGVAAASAGVAAVAFQGIGDALKALNDYQLDPTEAHFQALQEAMANLSPAGRDFVRFLDADLMPELERLQTIAAEGLLPGAEQGLRELMDLAPQVRRIMAELADTTGDLLAEAGGNLNDDRWREFFTFLENEARPTLTELGRTVGNFTEGLANLWMTFNPLADGFSRGFLQMSRDFKQWSDELAESRGFAEFVAYVDRVTPKAWETLGALAQAMIELVEAAAPVGEAALPIIKALADALGALADSSFGPTLIGIAAAMSAITRVIALYNIANGSALVKMLGGLGALRLLGVGAALAATSFGIDKLVQALTGAQQLDVRQLADDLEYLAQTGFRSGTLLDVFGDDLQGFIRDVKTLQGEIVPDSLVPDFVQRGFAHARDNIEELDMSLAQMVHSGNIQEARDAFRAFSDAAAASGISMDDLVDLFPNYSSAMRAASSQQKALRDTAKGAGGEQDDLKEKLKRTRREAQELKEEFKKLNDVLAGRGEMRAYQQSLLDITDRLKERKQLLQDLREAQDDLHTAQSDSSRERKRLQQDLADAERDLKKADTRDERQSAQRKIEDIKLKLGDQGGEIEQARDRIRDLKDELKDYDLTLDTSKQAGIDNAAALDEIASSALTVAERMGKTKESMKFLSEAKQHYIETARQFGATKDKAEELADELFNLDGIDPDIWLREHGFDDTKKKAKDTKAEIDKIPDEIETKLKATDLASRPAEDVKRELDGVPDEVEAKLIATDLISPKARDAKDELDRVPERVQSKLEALDHATRTIDTVASKLRAIDGDRATVTLRTERINITRNMYISGYQTWGGLQRAQGGLVQFNADGRLNRVGDVRNRHIAERVPAGTWRVFGEDETGGESYIPLANDWRRPRAVQIWEETGRMLGLRFARYAEGAIRTPERPAMPDETHPQQIGAMFPNATFQVQDMRQVERWHRDQDRAEAAGGRSVTR